MTLPFAWTARGSHRTTGMILAMLAYSFLSWQDATVKWLVNTLPVFQILFMRSLILVAICLTLGGGDLARRAVASPCRALLLRRGVITLAAWFCFFTAARSLPLGQLITLWFTAPVVVALLAAPLLGERVGPARWGAIALGFAGTVAAVQPVDLAISAATTLVLTGAGLWGYGVIMTRQIARQEPSLVQMLFNNSFFLLATGIGLSLSGHTPSLQESALLLLIGAFAGIGQFCLFESARFVPASLTASLEYTALVWAFLLGFAMWGEAPSPGVYAGAVTILAAGTTLFLAERRCAIISKAS